MLWSRNEKTMDFWEHLEELRWVILKCLGALVVGTGVSLAFTGAIFRLLTAPLDSLEGVEVFYAGPLDAFLIMLKMALLGGVVLAAPFLMIFIWSFVAPGLKVSERKAVYIGGGAGLAFFALGVVFGYYMLSIVLPLLAGFGVEGIMHRWFLKKYIDLCFRMLLGVGVAFELPVILVMLVHLGLIEVETLVKGRPYAMVAALVVAALLTPPDPFTQLMLGIPLIVLYELSIIASRWLQRWLARKEARAEDDESISDD